jgi:hypothetical protein
MRRINWRYPQVAGVLSGHKVASAGTGGNDIICSSAMTTENHCRRTLFDQALIPDPNSEFGASARPKIALDVLLPTLDGS